MTVNLWSPGGDCHIGLTSGHTFIVPSDKAGVEVPPRFRREAIARGCIPVGAELEQPDTVDPAGTIRAAAMNAIAGAGGPDVTQGQPAVRRPTAGDPAAPASTATTGGATVGEETPTSGRRRIVKLKKVDAEPASARIPLRDVDNDAIGPDGPIGGITASIGRREEHADILAAFAEAEKRRVPFPTAETNRNTAYEVLEAMPNYPDSLRGKAGKQRLFRLLRQMRADREIEICGFMGAGRHWREGYRIVRGEN